MRSAKKLLAVLTAAVVSVCAFTVNASAANPKKAASGKSCSTKITVSEDFAFDVVTEGDITIRITSEASSMDFYLYGPQGGLIRADDASMSKGKAKISSEKVTTTWKSSSKKAVGTITYENVKKGTYTFRVGKAINSSGKQKITFTATYPSKTGPSTKINGLKVVLKKGEKVRLGAIVESDDAKITWTSGRESVAKVSDSGVVTAKKKGVSVITAKSGISTAEIRIVVE